MTWPIATLCLSSDKCVLLSMQPFLRLKHNIFSDPLTVHDFRWGEVSTNACFVHGGSQFGRLGEHLGEISYVGKNVGWLYLLTYSNILVYCFDLTLWTCSSSSIDSIQFIYIAPSHFTVIRFKTLQNWTIYRII